MHTRVSRVLCKAGDFRQCVLILKMTTFKLKMTVSLRN